MFSPDFNIPDGIKIATIIMAGWAGWASFDKATKAMKLLLLWICFYLVLNILTYVLAYLGQNNLWVFHIITFIEYCVLTYLFSFWQKKHLFRKILRISLPVFTLIWILSKFWFEDFSSVDIHTSALSYTLLTGISGYSLFHRTTKNLETIFKDFQFWVSAGILFYCSGNLIIFSFTFGKTIWIIHNMIVIIAHLFYLRGFRCRGRQ